MGFYVFLSSFRRKYLLTTEMVFTSRILSNLGKIFFIKQAIHGTGSDLDLHTLPRLICCRAPCFPPLFCFHAILARARSSFTYIVICCSYTIVLLSSRSRNRNRQSFTTFGNDYILFFYINFFCYINIVLFCFHSINVHCI